jgi:NTE family protein
MPRASIASFLIVIVVCLSSFGANAAEETSRPRVGLVLSGGGARGLAHVGVLKVLEEMNIPVDAIAGTSMGAVVGGLYASGMSANEIEKMLLTVDWQDAFSDRLPRRDLGFRRKQDDDNFLVHYALGIGSEGFKLPKGLIQGQKLSQVLRTATLTVAATNNFDKLPIPFRAVATDLETGEPVVMRSGDLVIAMRASMSLPGAFIPAEREGRLLVDGGLTENLPIDVAQAMNVDVLIVVDVSSPLRSRTELNSPLEIPLQSFAIMMRSRTEEQRALLHNRDIVIEPQLGNYANMDFVHVVKASSAGEQATRDATARLAALSVSESAYKQYLAARGSRDVAPPKVAFVRTDADASRYQRMVKETLGDIVDKPLDKAVIETRLDNLYALDLFESVDYTVVEENGQTGLEFHLRRKSWGPNYVRFGLNIEDDFEGNSRYNAAMRFISTELNELGGEWLTDLQIGDHPRFYSEFYQPLGFGHRYFVSPHAGYEIRNLEVHDINDRITEYRLREYNGGLDFGRELGKWGEWRAGIFRGAGNSRVRVGDPTIPEQSFDSGGYFARVTYDQIDSVFFPRNGEQFQMQWIGQRTDAGSDRNSDRVELNGLVARSFGKHTVMFWASGGATLNRPVYAQDYFTLGGFLNLSGLRTGELSGPNYGIGRFIYYRNISRGGSGVFDVPLYLGFSVEAGNVWPDLNDASFGNLSKNGSVFLGADTFLGPIYLAAGSDTTGQSAFYLFLGRTF